ncbi:MAG: type II toxin-antitoxin system HicB family antitoxin [Blastocatellales bacterium]|nr:type II toxin-antitoxin system HicB family antitoxin [Blastocatellales bacterium]
MLTYKGYQGIVAYDEEAHIFHGEVINTRDVITFQGTTVKQLEKAFRDSVDDYLEFCEVRGEDPDKPFSGTLSLRVAPDLHRALHLRAKQTGKSLNSLIEEALRQAVTPLTSAR